MSDEATSVERFESDLARRHPHAPLHAQLARNDSRLLEELVAMRKRKHLSQDTVAARMNCSVTAVSNFERLGDDPHLSTIRRYAAAVGATIITDVQDFSELHV
jgi:DNA-binding transcriptional regulator YiaG